MKIKSRICSQQRKIRRRIRVTKRMVSKMKIKSRICSQSYSFSSSCS